MTRVLVVHHDIDVADIQADELRRAGYEVDQCVGPIGGAPCPVMNGMPSWQVEAADVVIYDAWAYQGRPELIDDLRLVHPDKPLVISSGSLLLDWEADAANGAELVHGSPNTSQLARAVEVASTSTAAIAAGATARCPGRDANLVDTPTLFCATGGATPRGTAHGILARCR